jgi:hypothetical protein
VDYFDDDTVEDEANAEVSLGEVLTERQLLEGLLVHSANNFALTLARWDSGSVAAFVAKMNRTATRLGMDHSHFADPSGFDQGSQSTAGDLLKVAVPDMNNPTFAAIVRMTSVTLPVAGTISSYTPLLGFQGVIGVKSGFTSVAGGCDIVAVVRDVHGLPVLVLSAVTGQEGPNVLGTAGLIALNLADHPRGGGGGPCQRGRSHCRGGGALDGRCLELARGDRGPRAGGRAAGNRRCGAGHPDRLHGGGAGDTAAGDAGRPARAPSQADHAPTPILT